MMVKDIMAILAAKGNEAYKRILLNHGVKEPFFGVKIEELKKIQKQIRKDYQLAKDLYATGNADAMYLAGLIADDDKMTKKDLQQWISTARSTNIIEYTVPWVAAQGNHGYALALEWIDAANASTAAAGWNTLSGVVALQSNETLDLKKLEGLLERIKRQIAAAPERVQHCMNGFVTAAGIYVPGLTDKAISLAEYLSTLSTGNGKILKLPSAMAYIKKAQSKGLIGKKKKMVKC